MCLARHLAFKMVCEVCSFSHINTLAPPGIVSARFLLTTQYTLKAHPISQHSIKSGRCCVNPTVLTLHAMALNTPELCSCQETHLAHQYRRRYNFLKDFKIQPKICIFVCYYKPRFTPNGYLVESLKIIVVLAVIFALPMCL